MCTLCQQKYEIIYILLLLLSFNLLIDLQLSIWNCCKPFSLLLLKFQLLCLLLLYHIYYLLFAYTAPTRKVTKLFKNASFHSEPSNKIFILLDTI